MVVRSVVVRMLTGLPIIMTMLALPATPALAAAGRLDRSFAGDGRVTAFPRGAMGFAVAIDAKRRIVVAGTSLGAATNVAIARFLRNGTLDRRFGGGDGRVTTDLGGSDYGFDLALGPRGRIVVAGERNRPSGTAMAVAVYGPRGALDRRFSKDGIAFVRFGKRFQGANAVAVGPGGKLVIAGSTSNGETSRWALARLLPAGPRDRTFGGDGRVTLDLSSSAEQINDIAIVGRGKVVAAGSAEVGLTPRIAIARVLASGRLDRTFGREGVKTTDVARGADAADGVTEQADGKLIVVGHVANHGNADWGVLRYGPNGRLDDSFGGHGIRILRFGADYEFASDSAVQPNGRIVVVGRIRRKDNDQFGVVRLKPNGAYDQNFSKDGRVVVDFDRGSDTARSVVLQPNGRIVVAGDATDRGSRRIGVVRLSAS
jgi:uncharacterized delta-60 repeat protein